MIHENCMAGLRPRTVFRDLSKIFRSAQLWELRRPVQGAPDLLFGLRAAYSRRLSVGRSSSLGWRSSGLLESAWLSLSFLLFELVSLSSALGSGRWVRRFKLGLFASSGEGLRFSSWASCVLTLL